MPTDKKGKHGEVRGKVPISCHMNEGSSKIGRSFLCGIIERFVSDLLAVPGVSLCILVLVLPIGRYGSELIRCCFGVAVERKHP